MIRVRSLATLAVALLLAVVTSGCGDRSTDPAGRVAVRIAPVFSQTQSTPILPVDELRVRVFDESAEVLLAQVSVPVLPSDQEVEAELEVDASPGDPLVVEVALLDGGVDVYVGGPVAILPTEVPVEVPVAYVGRDACRETVGSAVVGPVGGSPGVVQGALEVGDCFLSMAESFADRWRLDLPGDAGLDLGVSGAPGALLLSVETEGGQLLAGGDADALRVALPAGSYVVVVTSAAPLLSTGYDLRVGEYDRCDADTGSLTPGPVASGTLTSVDCPLSDGRSADLWRIDLSSTTPFRLDLESQAFDTQLLLTDAAAVDPFATEILDEDDDGGLGTDALLAGVLRPGSYRVWATSFSSGETGPYQISLQPLNPGPPSLVVRAVSALGVGGLGGVCQSAQTYLFEFGYEDGDGDLVSPGGITIRLTGIPSQSQTIKGLSWSDFPDLNPYAGYAEFVLCETFGTSDTGKLAEVFLTDAAGGASAIFSTTLTPVSGTAPGRAPGSSSSPVAVNRR